MLKGAVRPLQAQEARSVSNVFLVAKKGTSKRRPVINLRRLNDFIPNEKFKMEGWLEVKEAVSRDCWFARMDLKDADLSVPIHADSQPYLAFRWRGTLYCWSQLPFGLKSSARVFTKLLRPVVAALRKEGITLIVYLDDFLILAPSATLFEEHARRTRGMLQSLGYTVNAEKSVLSATQRVTFLGYEIDSSTMTLSVPTDKIIQIKASVRAVLVAGTVTLHAFSSVVGRLGALATIIRCIFAITARRSRRQFRAQSDEFVVLTPRFLSRNKPGWIYSGGWIT